MRDKFTSNLMERAFTYMLHKHSIMLQLANAGLDDDDIPIVVEFLNEHPQIKNVNLSENLIENQGALELSKLKWVKYLDLSNNYIDDDGIKYLTTNKDIKKLLLDYNSISKECAEFLLEGGHTTHLERFEIGHNLFKGDYPDLFKKLHKGGQLSAFHQSARTNPSTTKNNISNAFFHHKVEGAAKPAFHSNNHRLIPTKSS